MDFLFSNALGFELHFQIQFRSGVFPNSKFLPAAACHAEGGAREIISRSILALLAAARLASKFAPGKLASGEIGLQDRQQRGRSYCEMTLDWPSGGADKIWTNTFDK